MSFRSLCRSAISHLTLRVRVVEERKILVMSRFGPEGRHREALPAGIYFTIPFLDQVVQSHSAEEQVINTTNELVRSLDDVKIQLESSFTLQVLDGVKATFEVDDYQAETVLLVREKIKKEFLKKNYHDLTEDQRFNICKDATGTINEKLTAWGVVCRRLKTRILFKESGEEWTMEHEKYKPSVTILSSPAATEVEDQKRKRKNDIRETQKNLPLLDRLLLNFKYMCCEYIEDFTGILLRSEALIITAPVKRKEVPPINELFLYLSLLNTNSKFNLHTIPPRVVVHWDWENLTPSKEFDLTKVDKRLRLALEANSVLTAEEEMPPVMLYSNRKCLTHQLPDGYKYIETPMGKDEADIEIIKHIILWHYQYIWSKRKQDLWHLFKSWAMSVDKEMLRENTFIVLISEDAINGKLMRHMREMGHSNFVFCPKNAEQLINESNLHLIFEVLISSKEPAEEDYKAYVNPKYVAKQEPVLVELPAPPGWTKKFFPKKSGKPQKNEIVFTSPTGVEIRSRKQLKEYLTGKGKGGPDISEFDWGTGEKKSSTSKHS